MPVIHDFSKYKLDGRTVLQEALKYKCLWEELCAKDENDNGDNVDT